MRRFIKPTFIAILVTLFSCNQPSKQENDPATNPDTLANSESPDTTATTADVSEQEPSDQGISLPNELVQFVPENYLALDTAAGDLNLDGISDYILVLKRKGEENYTETDNPNRRPLLILIRDTNNTLQLARRNDNTVLRSDDGGVMGDPYQGITIKNGYFSVEHNGGSASRWVRIITYKYAKQENEWFLHKDGSESYHTSDPDKVESVIKTTKDFGQVKFEAFDIFKEE